MCIKLGGNNSRPELISNSPLIPDNFSTNQTIIPKQILSRDNFSRNNLNIPGAVPATMVNIQGMICENPVKKNPETDKNLIYSSNYKSEITSLVNSMHAELKAVNKITPKQLKEIQNFDLPQRDMFVTAIQQLELLKNKKISAADYMMNIMQHAADLSGNDHKKFVKLTGEAFSDIPIPLDLFRKALGAGPHTAGNLLEPMLDKIVEEQGGSFGFNNNVTDDIDPVKNTMTHHAGEFLQVGYKRGNFIGKLAGNIIDRNTLIIQDKKNEGDIRSSSFSVMTGAALKDNRITPQDAVKLFSWAFREDSGGKTPPPYGSKETEGKYLKFKDYKIENWLKEYNKAFPNEPIG